MRLPEHGAKYASLFAEASAKHQVDPLLLAAICSRESNFGLALKPPGPGGVGDGGHGRGLMQIDDRAHPDWISSGRWWDAADSIDKGAEVLADAFRYFDKHRSALPMLSDATLRTRAAVAAYNVGAGTVRACLRQGMDPDKYTTGGDYSADVLRRRAAFAEEAPS